MTAALMHRVFVEYSPAGGATTCAEIAVDSRASTEKNEGLSILLLWTDAFARRFQSGYRPAHRRLLHNLTVPSKTR